MRFRRSEPNHELVLAVTGRRSYPYPPNDGPFGDVAYRICDMLRDLIFHPRVYLHAYTLRMENSKGQKRLLTALPFDVPDPMLSFYGVVGGFDLLPSVDNGQYVL